MENYPLSEPRMEYRDFMTYRNGLISLAKLKLRGDMSQDNLRASLNFFRGRHQRRIDVRDRYCFECPDDVKDFFERIASKRPDLQERYLERVDMMTSRIEGIHEKNPRIDASYCVWLTKREGKVIPFPSVMVNVEGVGDIYLRAD